MSISVGLSAELRDLLVLQLVPGLGPRLTAALLKRFGSAGAVLQAAPERLSEVPYLGDKLARDLHQAFRQVDLTAELELIDRHDVRLLGLGSPDYPARLQNIADPPALLYMRGTVEARDGKAVAVVGSRHGTAYGRRIAERLATDLAHRGYTVVSGLARGIDSIAHHAALKAGGRTLAVLAGGLAKIYPPEHAELAREVQAAGALLSEASMKMEPMATMFPARNRLISGLSQAVVVVEAAERSGALITARHAAEQGRGVFAVPGPVDSPASGGTNALIREGGVLVRGIDDILEELEGVSAPARPAVAAAPAPPPGLDDRQRRLWDFLADQPRHVDEMTQQLALNVAEITAALLPLEMKRIVRRLPGNRYERA